MKKKVQKQAEAAAALDDTDSDDDLLSAAQVNAGMGKLVQEASMSLAQ